MSGSARFLILLLLLGAIVGVGAIFRCEGSAPVVETEPTIYVGKERGGAELRLSDEGSGLRLLQVKLVHADGESVLLTRAFGGELLRGGDAGLYGELVDLAIDAKTLKLDEGEAFLDIRVRDWSWADWLRGNLTELRVPVVVDMSPPRVSVATGLTYVKRGGAGAVRYRVTEETSRDGVEVGDAFFPGYPAPGGSSKDRVAVFAIPDDAPKNPPIRVVAEDRVGNRGTSGWSTRLQERKFRDSKIRLPDSFLENKVPSLAALTGVQADSPIEAFQEINERVRADNEKRIRAAIGQSAGTPMWKGSFVQMRNSAVTSRFAERRTYWYDGKQVSKATHYGYDLAATAGAPIAAANAGRVVYADDLGIYGNCVILDHGLGVSTLYGHLSRMDVAVGDEVERGQSVGASGQTGLAGGDHLHFGVLVGDVDVDPVEWWDGKFVRERIDAQVSPAPPKADDEEEGS